MRDKLRSVAAYRAAFFLCVFFALCPVYLFQFISLFYHDLVDSPSVTAGVLDLSQCDLSRGSGYPLDGEWEFYNGTAPSGVAVPTDSNRIVKVPMPWSQYDQYGLSLDKRSAYSYRLLLRNCPGDIPLTVYIPNSYTAYRIYLNGNLISGRSLARFEGKSEAQERKWSNFHAFREGIFLPEGSTAELVVELRSSHIGGLYVTPVIVNAGLDAQRTEFRRLLVAGYVGVLLLCILGFLWRLLIHDRSVPSVALICMDLLVLARISIMGEFFDVIQAALPFFQQYEANAYLQSLTLFLPAVFIYSIRQAIHLEVRRGIIILTMLYEAVFSVLILLCAVSGRPILQHLFCQLSYLPMVYILFQLYRSASQRTPYSIWVTLILLLSMVSTIGANLNASGVLVINISMFAPTCFVLSVLLQVLLSLRLSQEIQRRALEAETLTLQLRDSRNSLMLSQIKPHFLYNTLIAIHMLCLQAPAEAAEAVLTFAEYLRSNMRSLSSDQLIPFSQELSHITNYVAIERLRFEERLTFRTEIQTDAFLIPPLSVQPIVENAIKHGACHNISGGTVTLRTYETATAWCVEICDDGPGFDTDILNHPKADSFGLNNIVFRLREKVGAEVTIHSAYGSGTTVLVSVPRKEQA